MPLLLLPFMISQSMHREFPIDFSTVLVPGKHSRQRVKGKGQRAKDKGQRAKGFSCLILQAVAMEARGSGS